MISSIGSFVLGIGFVVFLWDLLRPRKNPPLAERYPWNAGTLEWLAEVPNKPWGSSLHPRNRQPLSAMGPA